MRVDLASGRSRRIQRYVENYGFGGYQPGQNMRDEPVDDLLPDMRLVSHRLFYNHDERGGSAEDGDQYYLILQGRQQRLEKAAKGIGAQFPKIALGASCVRLDGRTAESGYTPRTRAQKMEIFVTQILALDYSRQHLVDEGEFRKIASKQAKLFHKGAQVAALFNFDLAVTYTRNFIDKKFQALMLDDSDRGKTEFAKIALKAYDEVTPALSVLNKDRAQDVQRRLRNSRLLAPYL